ncbi:MAG: tRNA (5-methylaminomethyl-2-thiouridine)(34)-methyltransferase MnmD, partial [Trueperaceae bacterium]
MTDDDRAHALPHAPRPQAGGGPGQVESTSDRVIITGDGSRTLHHAEAGQTYGSEHGAVAEARHVFLHGSGVAERLAAGRPTRVIEVGLGSGLNLLLTWDRARRCGTSLAYLAFEREPPRPAEVAALGYHDLVDDPALVPAWLRVLESLQRHAADGAPRLWTSSDGPDGTSVGDGPALPGLTLQVALGDALAGDGVSPSVLTRGALAQHPADAVYHDAFSPAASPGLWSPAFLTACAGALAPGGTWVSYSVAGSVRRALAEAGLEVRKLRGPPGG